MKGRMFPARWERSLLGGQPCAPSPTHPRLGDRNRCTVILELVGIQYYEYYVQDNWHSSISQSQILRWRYRARIDEKPRCSSRNPKPRSHLESRSFHFCGAVKFWSFSLRPHARVLSSGVWLTWRKLCAAANCPSFIFQPL